MPPRPRTLPLDSLAPHIVIFGAAVRPGGIPSPTLRRRVEAAHQLGETVPEAIFLPTGGIGLHGPAEAEVMRRLLMEHGVPPSRIRLEPTGTDTFSSAKAVAAMLEPAARGQTVFVATSRYHMRRCVTLLRLAGLDARPGAAPAFRAPGEWRWRLRDWLAWPYDAMLMILWRLRSWTGTGRKHRKRALDDYS